MCCGRVRETGGLSSQSSRLLLHRTRAAVTPPPPLLLLPHAGPRPSSDATITSRRRDCRAQPTVNQSSWGAAPSATSRTQPRSWP
jgi:hypothetical protein